MRQNNKSKWSGNNRDNKQSGGRGFNKGGFGGNRQMHKVICSECGMDCEVPFKPTGEKPVYCSNCFDKKGGSRGDRRSGGNFGGSTAGGNQNKEQLEKIVLKLDQILEVLKGSTPAVKSPIKKEVKEKKITKAPAKKAVKKTTKKTAKKK
jgi:DNA-directed RNA polymerase